MQCPKPTKKDRINEQVKREEKAKDRELKKLVIGKKCELCPNPATDPHHIIPRRYRFWRWLAQNIAPLCRRCHDKAQKNVDGLNDKLFKAHNLPENFRQYPLSL